MINLDLPLDPERRPGLLRSISRLPHLCYRALRWQALRGGWLPRFLRQSGFDRSAVSEGTPIDVMVLVSDHFEPARRDGDEAATASVRSWCASYEQMAGRHRDSDDRPPQHTWFYRYDYPNAGCVQALSESVFRGFGEIEFHLHHGHDSHEMLANTLSSGAEWFRQFGAMWTAEEKPRTAFGYVAGNSALDNGAGDDALSGCDTELTALRESGCFADFTFPNLGSRAQPTQTNSIYYATEDGKPKSYSTGKPLVVGQEGSGDLLIFQGPVSIDWEAGYFDDAALEDSSPAHPRRLANWLAANVHVQGRPEWLFVKLHTHGMQNRASFLSPSQELLFAAMCAWWTRPPFRLHFVTAREAYNIARAAEAGHRGNPHDYRDFIVPQPANRRILCSAPWRLLSHTKDRIHLRIEKMGPVRIQFAGRVLRMLSGDIREVEARFCGGELTHLRIEGQGPFLVQPGHYARLIQKESSREEWSEHSVQTGYFE